jgi:hypothetical protein
MWHWKQPSPGSPLPSSHCSPVSTVPFPQSGASVVEVVLVEVLVVLVVDTAAAHSPAVQSPLQHWPFDRQVARFGLQLESAIARLAKVLPTRKTTSAISVVRFTEWPISGRAFIVTSSDPASMR